MYCRFHCIGFILDQKTISTDTVTTQTQCQTEFKLITKLPQANPSEKLHNASQAFVFENIYNDNLQCFIM